MSADAIRYLAVRLDGHRSYITIEWPLRAVRAVDQRQYERHTDPDGFVWYREISKKENDSAYRK